MNENHSLEKILPAKLQLTCKVVGDFSPKTSLGTAVEDFILDAVLLERLLAERHGVIFDSLVFFFRNASGQINKKISSKRGQHEA